MKSPADMTKSEFLIGDQALGDIVIQKGTPIFLSPISDFLVPQQGQSHFVTCAYGDEEFLMIDISTQAGHAFYQTSVAPKHHTMTFYKIDSALLGPIKPRDVHAAKPMAAQPELR